MTPKETKKAGRIFTDRPCDRESGLVIGAVREGAPAMCARVLEFARLEEGDDRRLAVGADHDLALDGDVGTRVLRIARVVGMLDPDHLAFVAGDGVGGRCRRCRLTCGNQGRDGQGSGEEE